MEGFLEEVSNVPFPIFCVPSCRSECPSRRYISLQCSRKKMLFLLDCGLCGVGVRKQRRGTPLGEMASPGGPTGRWS